MRRGIVTDLAMNGSAAIHDYEIARFGATSADVASRKPLRGRNNLFMSGTLNWA